MLAVSIAASSSGQTDLARISIRWPFSYSCNYYLQFSFTECGLILLGGGRMMGYVKPAKSITLVFAEQFFNRQDASIIT